MPEVLSKNSSIQEVLWNFSRFKDEKQCLTLRDNPHFYEELPTSPEAYGDGVQIDPTEDFQHSDKFYVLTDKAELVYTMTDHWGQVSQSFGNFWRPHNAIIFKGLGVVFLFFPLFLMYVLPDSRGLRGEGIIKAILGGTHCGFCKRLPASTIPRASRNCHGPQPIITLECPWVGWNFQVVAWRCLTGYPPMHSPVDTSLRVCTGREAPETSPVRCDVIIYLTASANIDIASGPFAADVRETRV